MLQQTTGAWEDWQWESSEAGGLACPLRDGMKCTVYVSFNRQKLNGVTVSPFTTLWPTFLTITLFVQLRWHHCLCVFATTRALASALALNLATVRALSLVTACAFATTGGLATVGALVTARAFTTVTPVALATARDLATADVFATAAGRLATAGRLAIAGALAR